MQPSLTFEFTASAAWEALSAPAQGVLRGMLELAFRRDGVWAVDGTPKEICHWFGSELGRRPAEIMDGLKELEEGGYVAKGRWGPESRYVVKAPLDNP